MAENTAIEWADHTFNPWWGCTKVSAACDHCYAETWSDRWAPGQWGPHAPRRRTSAANWRKPLQWNARAAKEGRRYRVFCASMADVFDNHRSITSGWHCDLWHLIASTPNLDWLLLTKRPQNIAKMLPETYGAPAWGNGWPNVWLGTTVENQAEADRRIPALLSVPARIRFLSCEPLLEPVDLQMNSQGVPCNQWGLPLGPCGYYCSEEHGHVDHNANRLHWVIAGGESGKHARPSHPHWFLHLRDQCAAASVPFFFKQWGEYLHLSVFNPWSRANTPQIVVNGETYLRVGKKAAGRYLFDGYYDQVPRHA